MLTTIFIRTCLGELGKIRVLSRGFSLYVPDIFWTRRTVNLFHEVFGFTPNDKTFFDPELTIKSIVTISWTSNEWIPIQGCL